MADTKDSVSKTGMTRTAAWRGRLSRSEAKLQLAIPEWQRSVDYRRGTPFEDASDEDRIVVNYDWALTKAKQARLFSQVPQVILTAKHPSLASAVPVFSKVLNDTLTTARVGVAIDECLPDCINAAGFGAVLVSYEALTDVVKMPRIDLSAYPPDVAQQLIAAGQVPMEDVTRVTDARFRVQHVAPTDFLKPDDFTGSDFDDAPWIGRRGRIKKAEAKALFRLSSKQLDDAGDDNFQSTNKLNSNPDVPEDEDYVGFREVFYKRHVYHTDETSFDALHHLVFITGIDEPVIDEPWKGQRYDPQTYKYLGACKFPLRVLTLTHISGQAIPPSDTAIGRPQVDEIIRARSQMILQRQRSFPIRWFDVNRVDPDVQDALMKGTYQGMIPMQGSGANAIGEVARAAYPREDFEFGNVAERDLQKMWSLGPNQTGDFASGARSASEANIVETASQTEMSYQRARTASFFVGIAEVMAGLLCLYGDFTLPEVGQDGQQRLQAWDRSTINQSVVFSILADSTVLLDSNQRMAKLAHFYNLAAPSGFIDVQPLLREMASLVGLDPDVTVKVPTPKPPDPPNVSYRFSGVEDLMNPLVLATLLKAGLAASPQELEAAKVMIQSLTVPPVAPVPPPIGPGGPAGAPPIPGGPEPLPAGVMPAGGPPTAPVGSVPTWGTAPRVDRRRAEQ